MTEQQPQNAALVQQQALAAQLKATVEARYVLALRKPRNLDTVRTKLMAECRRPRFADEARYAVPRGRKQNEQTGQWEDNIVEGPSIRFAEAAMRCMTNIDTNTMVIYDDAAARQVRVIATDLEANITYSKDITIAKTQERRKLRQNQVPIRERYTSTGELVYIVEIPDSELQNVQAAAESKVLRTLILRLVPGDITDECMDLCVAVIKDEHAKDPRDAIKKLCDAYARIGVTADELVKYLDKPLDQMTPAEYQHLRSLGIALKDGQVQWREALERKLEGRPVVQDAPKEPAAPPPATAPDVVQEPPKDAKPAQAAPAPTTAPKGNAGAKAAAKEARERAAKDKAAEAPAPAVQATLNTAPPATEPKPEGKAADWEAAKADAAARDKARESKPASASSSPSGDAPPMDDVPPPGDDDSWMS